MDQKAEQIKVVQKGAASAGEGSRRWAVLNVPPLEAASEKKWRLVPMARRESALLHPDDFVLLTDSVKCRLVRIEDISRLEAREDCTLVHFSDGEILVRRSLVECERRLESCTFFRASRGCIVNLSHVKRPRLLRDGRLVFLLKDGKEVLFSRRQTALFRTRRGL